MKHARAVQGRLGPDSVADLKIVGTSPLMMDMPPLPYLLVIGAMEKQSDIIRARFQVRLRSQGEVLVIESAEIESYKHEALRLWYVARHLLAQSASLRLQLSERQLLRETLQANIDRLRLQHPDTLREAPVPIQLPTQGLSLSPLHQGILAQIGYPLQAVEGNLILQAGDPLFGHRVSQALATAV